MNGKEFKLAMSNPKNIYCLVSIDSAMIDLYVDRFKSAIKADNIVYGEIKPYGKLFKKKTLNVLYMPSIDEKLFERKEFIFVYTDSIDKRTSLYKKYKDQIIELNNNYTDFIMKNSDMTEDQAKEFARIHNNNLGLIRNNLTIYNDSNKEYNRFIDYSGESTVWVDAFLRKKPLPNYIESPISIMALLSVNCQNILKVKQKNTIGMNPYIIQCVSPLAEINTEEELIQIINDCFYLDCQIKKGLFDVNNALKYLKVRRYYATSN